MTPTPTLQIHVALNDIEPRIWRRIWVAADTRLDELHLILQGAMGWDNCHLHGFRKGKRIFTDDPEPGSRQEDEFHFVLGQLLRKKGDRLHYDYDFGDDWLHTITLERLFPGLPEKSVELPLLIDGANNCPPEDCGGPWGYGDFLERLKAKDPETLEWLKSMEHPADWSPQKFDVEAFHLSMLEMMQSDEQALLESLFEEYEMTTSTEPMPRWTALEQQLALKKLHTFVQGPRWKVLFDPVNLAAAEGIAAFARDNDEPAVQVPFLTDLIRDHVAYDLVKGDEDSVLEAFAKSNPDLPQGACDFLDLMGDSAFAPYQIVDIAKPGELELLELVAGLPIHASFSQAARNYDPNPGRGDLLFARIIPNGEELEIVGPTLACDFEPERVDDFLNFLAEGCRSLGGDPDDYFELMKPSMLHMVAYWMEQSTCIAEPTFPMAPLPGEEWDPGASIYILHSQTEARAALDACTEFQPHCDGIWQWFAEPSTTEVPGESQRAPSGWVIVTSTHMHLWASGRKAMKKLRRLVRSAKVPHARHFKTSYGLADEFPVVEGVS